MEPPTICIRVRQTLDWADRAAVDAGLIPAFRPKLEAWNAAFNIPYHEFRRRVKSIAELNWSRVEGALLVTNEPVPSDAVIVPVDDDDWFSPELAHRLGRETDPSIRGYHWKRHILEPERHRRRYKGLLKEALTRQVIFATNNYALREVPERETLLQNHLAASRYLHGHPREFRYLPLALSMHNRSLASQTALGHGRPAITREELVEAFDRYKTLYARPWLSRELRWAAPYVAAMADLMNELKLR